MNEATIRKWYEVFKNNKELVEIRVVGDRSYSGYFKDVETKGIQNKKELEELSKYSYDEKLHQNLSIKEQTLKPKYDEYKKLQTLIQRVPVLQKELDEIKKAIEQNSTAFSNKEIEIKAVVYDETNHKTKLDEFTLLQKQKDELTTIINDFKVQIASIDGEIKTLQATLDTNKIHQAKLATKQQDLLDYEKIKISLSDIFIFSKSLKSCCLVANLA